MPDLVNRTVFPLSGRASASAAFASPRGKAWDFAIAGQTFLSAASDDRPLLRQTAPIRKEQQDTESEPGEQSLAGWWLRSQESFHKGSGVLYQESRTTLEPGERFRESMGLDVWTPGQVTLLPETATLQAGADSDLLAQGVDGTTPIVYQASGSILYRLDGTTSTVVAWGGLTTILALELTATDYYVVSADGVYKGTVSGGAGTKVWTIPSTPGSVFYRRPFGAGALLFMDSSVYDLTDETGVWPKALPTATVAVIDPNPVWTSVVIGKGDVRAAMLSGDSSKLWTFAYSGFGGGAWLYYQTAGLPRGETIHSLVNYYNTYLVLGTNRGVRFAAYLEGGKDDIDFLYNYGPLTWEVPDGGSAVTGVATIGRYVYATANGAMPDATSGLIRIDPETEIGDNTGRFAWANDLCAGVAGTTGAVADLDGRPVFTIPATGSYIAHATQKAVSGYLTTGRIRFRTLEPKIFKLLRLRTDAMIGSVAVEAVTDEDSLAAVVTYSTPGIANHDEAALPLILGPVESLALKFTLTRSATDATDGPTMRSYQIKALPAPKRQRIYRLPLSVFDVERFANGTEVGHKGFAIERLRVLEAAEENGDLVLFQDFSTGDARLCVIEEIDFRQTSPPGKAGWGGYAYVTVRSVD